MKFPTNYSSILGLINSINPISYAKSRNFIDGKVTMLSPYISRGLISTKQIFETILSKGYSIEESFKLIQELAWRDFYQYTWIQQGNRIFEDLKHPQANVQNFQIPETLLNASTGILAIDSQLKHLFETGYLHNHFRMYTASLACNFGKSHWSMPAKWLYYHLLDGDLASNALSWQWVAGSFSSKKYFFNQENLNKYAYSNQRNTFIDLPYDQIETNNIPLNLQPTKEFIPEKLIFPETKKLTILPNSPILIYNSYNLDPLWRKDETKNKILLLEPSHFEKFPISQKVLNFILALSTNISEIQIFIGEFHDLTNLILQSNPKPTIIYKEHPLNNHYSGIEDPRDWMFPKIEGKFNSFFQYWRKAEKFL